MRRSWKRQRAAASVALATLCCPLLSCAGTTPSTPPTPSTSRSTGAVRADLTRPGAARKAVDALTRAAGPLQVIKVDVTAQSATLSALKEGRVVAWRWEQGLVTPVESDIEYIEQAPFDPADYDLSDLGVLFQRAARISGSSANQELQIVEYDHGQVVMTVTTRPESMPVFLRADGSPINRLDFTTEAGFAEAVKDTSAHSSRVLAMGWDQTDGFWADTPGKQKGVVDRRTRQARVPAWTSSRKADAHGATFRPEVVDPEILARLVRTLPADHGKPRAEVSVVISRQHQMALPVMTFTVDGEQVVTTLSGTDITDVVGG